MQAGARLERRRADSRHRRELLPRIARKRTKLGVYNCGGKPSDTGHRLHELDFAAAFHGSPGGKALLDLGVYVVDLPVEGRDDILHPAAAGGVPFAFDPVPVLSGVSKYIL